MMRRSVELMYMSIEGGWKEIGSGMRSVSDLPNPLSHCTARICKANETLQQVLYTLVIPGLDRHEHCFLDV